MNPTKSKIKGHQLGEPGHQKERSVLSEKGAWCLDQVSRGTRGEWPWGGFKMSPGWRCGSGSAGRGPQVLVQHRDPLREQRVHVERELHGPLCMGTPPHETSLPFLPRRPALGSLYFLVELGGAGFSFPLVSDSGDAAVQPDQLYLSNATLPTTPKAGGGGKRL